MSNILKCLLVVLIGFGSWSAQAAFSPVALSLVPPAQFPGRDFSITGLRLSGLWGVQRDIYGLDLSAIGNITEQDFVGAAFSGVFNYTKGQTTILGLQLAGVANVNTNQTSIYGVQLAVFLNQNTGNTRLVGLELALANLSAHTTVIGAQVGLYNEAQTVYGFQIGLVNKTESLHGIQIGLINYNAKGLFPVAPLLNMGF